jgi:exopolyphosphatase/guanosine-5'-triphosphate,3'-diphosphate pyrophosphatase
MEYALPECRTFMAENELNKEEYIMVAKLSAILEVADILDRNHRDKISEVEVSLKDKILVITTDTMEDITLEKSLLNKKSSFFAEVYGVTPKIKRKK